MSLNRALRALQLEEEDWDEQFSEEPEVRGAGAAGVDLTSPPGAGLPWLGTQLGGHRHTLAPWLAAGGGGGGRRPAGH